MEKKMLIAILLFLMSIIHSKLFDQNCKDGECFPSLGYHNREMIPNPISICISGLAHSCPEYFMGFGENDCIKCRTDYLPVALSHSRFGYVSKTVKLNINFYTNVSGSLYTHVVTFIPDISSTSMGFVPVFYDSDIVNVSHITKYFPKYTGWYIWPGKSFKINYPYVLATILIKTPGPYCCAMNNFGIGWNLCCGKICKCI